MPRVKYTFTGARLSNRKKRAKQLMKHKQKTKRKTGRQLGGKR